MGTVVGGPFFLSLLAEAQWKRGTADDALATLSAAIGFSRQHHCSYWEAELLRLEGEVRSSRAEAGALEVLDRAIAVAHEQGARMLELRAATSAARWLGEQGRAQEGVARLEPLVAGVESREESYDVTAARDLLAALA